MTQASILVVEDEMIVAENIREALSEMGYHVPDTACSSSDALASVEKNLPDLILMDIVLEGSEFDGVETARRIQKNHDIPVVFVTAYANDETLERGKVINRCACIRKPFNERELSTAIELALFRQQKDLEAKKIKTIKRDTILFAISFAIEWLLRHQRESRNADTENSKTREKGILEILERIGLAVDANRVAIFRQNTEIDPADGAQIQYIWVAPGTPHTLPHPATDNSPLAFTTSHWRALLTNGNSVAGDIGKFSEDERKFFEQYGISSFAMLPLFKDDFLWGFVTITSEVPRLWSEREMEALMMAGNIIGAILE